jgi:hypothetical protein
MEKVNPIIVPPSHIAFASEVAAIAEKNGIKSFTMEYTPDWTGSEAWDHRVKGSAKILFTAIDGRGRPCRNLSISFDARISHNIESNPESYN